MKKLSLSDRFCFLISTGLGLGYAPIAPGTFGSLLGIPLGIWFLNIPSWAAILICVVLFFIFSGLAHRVGKIKGESDASIIVSDEVLGQAITLLGVRYVGPQVILVTSTAHWRTPDWPVVLAGFLLFRLFDIFKPFPARTFDRTIKNGFGTILDDVVAGVYAAIVLYLGTKVTFN